MLNLNEYSKRVLELAQTNSFTRFVLLHNDYHLSSEVCPHDINELLEFLIKSYLNMGAEIGIGALLGAAGISAVGNLAGAGISAAGAASMNEDTMNFNREEAAKARQFQKDMYQQQLSDQQMLYEKYQSPEALARQFGKAGVNPAAVLGTGKGGFSGALPSVPSAPSGSAASISGLSNPMEYFAQALKGTTGDAVSVLNAITDKNLKDKQALKVLAEKANLDVQNSILKWQDMINNTIGSEKAKQELNSIVEQVGLYAAQKNYTLAQKLVADTIQKLNNKEFDIKEEELSQLKLRGTFLEADLNNSLEYQRETIKTEKSKQRMNISVANRENAEAKTINDTRADVIRYHKSLANIKDTEDFVSSNSAWNKVQQSLYELQVAKLIPHQVEQAIERAKKSNDWYEVNMLLGIVDEGVKAYGTYKGAKTGQGFVDAQDVQNDINRRYKEHIMHQDEKSKVYEPSNNVYYYR